MRVSLEDVCTKGSSNLKQSDVIDKNGEYEIYGASGLIGKVDFFHQEKPYIAVVKDGAGIGRTMLLPEKSSVIGTMQYILPNEKVTPKYLYYVIRYMHLEKYFTGATIPHIYFKDYRKEEFNLCDLSEQEKITSTLSKIETIITHLRTQLEKLDLLVKARFVEMFKDVKDFVPLSFYINSLLAGKSLAGEESCKNKVLKTGAVSYNYFDNSQVKNLPNKYIPLEEHRVNDGDVIISRMNTSELVGAAAYVWEAPANTFLPDRLWKANLNEEANPIFIWQLLIQQTTKDEMKKIASGTSGSMKNISKSGLLGIKVIKIAFDAQTQFANFVKQVEKSRCALQQELTQTQTLFDSLMQEYFG